ncbi:hypothetical protein F5Y18DRAFT_327858 [Xylariaceae sp. FL1019]|nr:hypothetical protein F5Y18DRAFT_327858 [Xylariaceae sp. FL1019]
MCEFQILLSSLQTAAGSTWGRYRGELSRESPRANRAAAAGAFYPTRLLCCTVSHCNAVPRVDHQMTKVTELLMMQQAGWHLLRLHTVGRLSADGLTIYCMGLHRPSGGHPLKHLGTSSSLTGVFFNQLLPCSRIFLVFDHIAWHAPLSISDRVFWSYGFAAFVFVSVWRWLIHSFVSSHVLNTTSYFVLGVLQYSRGIYTKGREH